MAEQMNNGRDEKIYVGPILADPATKELSVLISYGDKDSVAVAQVDKVTAEVLRVKSAGGSIKSPRGLRKHGDLYLR